MEEEIPSGTKVRGWESRTQESKGYKISLHVLAYLPFLALNSMLLLNMHTKEHFHLGLELKNFFFKCYQY